MTRNIQIVVGSVMGTAQEVAETVHDVLQGHGHKVETLEQFEVGQLDLEPSTTLIVCTSNTGMGELPRNINPFYQHLLNDTPSIDGKEFAVINLGDSSYPNFGQTGQVLYESLVNIGAKPISDTAIFDDQVIEDYEAESTRWANNFTQTLSTQ